MSLCKKALTAIFLCLLFVFPFILSASPSAEEQQAIKLPSPQMEGGRPLMEVLKDRKTIRDFSPQELSLQQLSNLLWAAFGINRPELGKRTVPSARNKQEIDLYVSTKDGLYLYEAKQHVLQLILKEDIRGETGLQPFVKEAAVNLIYVADYAKMEGYSPEHKDFYSACNTGYISQNVYLFCASEGLATVARGLVDRPVLAKRMDLRTDQKIILTQSVGYPKEKQAEKQ